MSEYVGSAYVKIIPDTQGFNSELDKQISTQSKAPLIDRSGIASDLRQMKADAAETAANVKKVEDAKVAEAVAVEKAGQAHEDYSVHAHRASIAGFGVRASTVALGAGALIAAEGLKELGNELAVSGAKADTLAGGLRNAAAAALSGDFAGAAKNIGTGLAAGLNPTATDEANRAVARADQLENAVALAQKILDLREQTAKAEGTIGTAAGRTRFELEKQLAAATAEYNALGSRVQRIAAAQFNLNPDLGNKVAVAATDKSRESDFQLQLERSKRSISRQEFTLPGQNEGLVEPGNLDLLHRKVARIGNDIATVHSITVDFDKQVVLLPTVVDGVVVSTKKAIDHFRKTGENLGKFSSDKAADQYAERLHLQQEKFYSKGPNDSEEQVNQARKKYLQGQINHLEAAGANTQAAKDRLDTLYGQLDTVESQITALSAKRVQLAETGFEIQLANARTVAQQDAALANRAEFATKQAKDKNIDAQTRANFQLEAAQAQNQIFENDKAAAAKAKSDAAEAARKAKEAYKDKLSVRESELQANADAAQLTERTIEDDKKALRAQIGFYKQEIDDKNLELVDRKGYASKELQAEAAIAALDKQHHADLVSLKEEKLGIQLQLAQLTDGNINDDKKAIKRQIAFYHAQSLDRKNLTDAQRLQARSSEIGARLQLKGLTDSAPRSSASDFFKEAASEFKSYGSNISTSGGILSGQDARAAFAARALSSGNIATTMAQQAQQTRSSALIEAQKTNVLLTTIAGRLTYGGATREPPAKAIANARRGAHVVASAV